MNAPAIKTHPYTSELSEALAELVACKDLKDEMDRLARMPPPAEGDPRKDAVLRGMRLSYDQRKPAAWEKAREVLKSMGWHRVEDAWPEEKRAIAMILDTGLLKCGVYDKFFGMPGKNDSYVEIYHNKRNQKTKDWVPNVIAWSYLQLPVF